MTVAEQFRVREVSRSYWRVSFDIGPVRPASLAAEYCLQQPDGIETDLGTAAGRLRQNL